MYKPNKKHLQPLLISNVNDLPEKHRRRLETSWAGVFYTEYFCRLREDPFADWMALSRPITWSGRWIPSLGRAILAIRSG